MKTLTVDTYKVISILKERGFSEVQAEGLIKAVQEADFSEIATKNDTLALKNDIRIIDTKINMLTVIGTGILVALIVNIIIGS